MSTNTHIRPDPLMTITLPLTIELPRKQTANKNFSLNQNIFRNAHRFVMAEAKTTFTQYLKEYLYYDPSINSVDSLKLPVDKPLWFVYTLYPGSKRRMDLANVLSAVQKFTDDALVDMGVLVDDDYKHVRAVDYRFGAVVAKGYALLEIYQIGD